MPQLTLLEGGPVGHRFVTEYWSDPLKPEQPAHLAVTIKDHSGVSLHAWYARVPHEVLYELVSEVGRVCWETWLFGTAQDTKHAFNRTVKYWRQEAKERAVGMELAREAGR